ncbi:hypothetical protein PIB30_036703 [Stylosanthes scabra]|uniref:Bromo domain-containing protein n=1 Tax=Stylosanthes scabra TaxID=79078 RepID=A0ABU6ZCK3_9FABA|nr:hypothetical protein [Stylosanthes scabra]
MSFPSSAFCVHQFNNNSNNVVLDSRPNKRAKVLEKSEDNSRMKKGTTEAAKITYFDAVKEHDEEKKKRSSSGMDRCKKMQCSVTLRRLLVHPDGVHFKKANYSNPLMDLENIQLKLGKDLYKKTDQFAADIRLVFRNAMFRYPSRHNEIHQAAAMLSELFETKWKDLEGKWEAEKVQKLEEDMAMAKAKAKPFKSNEGEKRKRILDVDLSIAIANAKLQWEKMKKSNEAVAVAQQNNVFIGRYSVWLQREKQREIMQKMERTVFFGDDNFKEAEFVTLTDFED